MNRAVRRSELPNQGTARKQHRVASRLVDALDDASARIVQELCKVGRNRREILKQMER